MTDRVTEQTTIDAPPEVVREVLLDFAAYPQWAKDLKAAEVVDPGSDGSNPDVRFRAAAMGRSTSYTLRYDLTDPSRVAWVLIDGDVTRKLDGHYELSASADGGTDVTYVLEAELKMPLPNFVKSRAQGRIMHAALVDLKNRAEARTR
ncbi:MAG: SRPBCC family protein [Acidimicrobiales bacterium]|nr:SRPBCC family protein [Acidimicrobiales bacterium]